MTSEGLSFSVHGRGSISFNTLGIATEVAPLDAVGLPQPLTRRISL